MGSPQQSEEDNLTHVAAPLTVNDALKFLGNKYSNCWPKKLFYNDGMSHMTSPGRQAPALLIDMYAYFFFPLVDYDFNKQW